MRILIVEDDSDIRDLLKQSLEEACFAVDVCEDGEKGLRMARINDYDLLILDNMLPGKSGTEICRELRSTGSGVLILMLSVNSEAGTKTDLLNAGADDYLTKPYSFEELLARIHALLRRAKSFSGNVLTVDNLQLDTRKHTCTRAGREITLTRKEFMLLTYLMKNVGTVLSRGMIMEHVWDMNADPFSNTIEAHITSLRKKVDTEEQKKLIYTVSGFGYKMMDSDATRSSEGSL